MFCFLEGQRFCCAIGRRRGPAGDRRRDERLSARFRGGEKAVLRILADWIRNRFPV
ncbi:hypothetical protein BH24ACT4_BH24ACT4_21160 [soil metagenome]